MVFVLESVFDWVVEDQDQTGSHGSINVAQVALEESFDAFFGQGLLVAVKGAAIFNFDVSSFTSGLHHEFSADSVEGEGDGFTGGDHELGEEESLEKVCLL